MSSSLNASPADAAGFGRRLRQLRGQRGWTLQRLAEVSHYSAQHLSNIENGNRVPTRELAAACERALGADGMLGGLVPTVAVPNPDVPIPAEAVVQSYRIALDAFRELGRTGSPRLVVEPVTASAKALATTAVAVRGRQQEPVWLLAARFAEFAGWMAQESGDVAGFLRWTQTASEWAGRGGQPAMNGYLWVRRALGAEYGGDAAGTVEHAGRAGACGGVTTRIRALAARRAAAGYAVTGDHAECFRALDQAADLLSGDTDKQDPDVSWGPRTSLTALARIRGGCLVTLGDYQGALAAFDEPGADDLTDHGSAAARFAVRRAQALAGLNEPAAAAAEISGVLPTLARLDSASARRDLATLARLLRRCRPTAETADLVHYLGSAGRPV
jgi:transcriptional regulator with XRE-family HTH domain